MEMNFHLQDSVVIKNKFDGNDFKIIVEIPENISTDQEKLKFVKDMLKELKTIIIKNYSDNSFIEMELEDNTLPLAINISTEIYQALHKVSLHESLKVDEVCDALLYYALTHKCAKE